jgi:WD40 repeat protein
LSVAVSHDGAWVVSGSKDRSVQFWDSKGAIVQCVLQGHKNSGEFLLVFFPPSGLLFGVLRELIDVSPPSHIRRFKSGWESLGYGQWGSASTDMYVLRFYNLSFF